MGRGDPFKVKQCLHFGSYFLRSVHLGAPADPMKDPLSCDYEQKALSPFALNRSSSAKKTGDGQGFLIVCKLNAFRKQFFQAQITDSLLTIGRSIGFWKILTEGKSLEIFGEAGALNFCSFCLEVGVEDLPGSFLDFLEEAHKNRNFCPVLNGDFQILEH